jgi:BirA family biotin operon repressor/biotin-[acetyl-CoA-carboxylase] ligase
MAKRVAIIGIGINVNQIKFDGQMRIPPTSLKIENRKDYDLTEVTSVLSGQIDLWYELWIEKGTEYIVDEWKKRSHIIGQTTNLSDGGKTFRGEVIDINSDGSIRFKNSDGMIKDFYSGELIN